jgi:hypothetical protein
MINRLGNLTLVLKEFNLGARNSAFDIKKQYYKQSDIHLNQELLRYEIWDAEAIRKRQAQMSKRGVRIWSIPPSS